MYSIRFPARYFQSPGLIHDLGKYIKEFDNKAYILIDSAVVDDLEASITQSIQHSKIQAIIDVHHGQCSDAEVTRCKLKFHENQSSIVVGIGGGKAIDTAKLVAAQTNTPLIIIPTIAASDAPCSALSVVYKENGKVDRDIFLARSPELILVDTQIILNAPSRFLAAGIGDALATWYEADACRRSKAKNCLKTQGAFLAYDIAKNCRDTILTYGIEAMENIRNKQHNYAFERIVEANILSSCIGFESGGVATAHAIHHGLCELDDVHHALHGEKVAIGILTSLLMTKQSDEYKRIKEFCIAVNLPIKLSDIGITHITNKKLQTIATRACRKGEIIHNEPFAVTETMVIDALAQLDQ